MPATYEDLVRLDLPEWQIGEIVAGALVVRRLPRPRGTNAYSALIALLRGPARHDWWILPRVELCLGSDVLVPDLSGWTRERMPKIEDVPWIELPPEWACDVLTDESRAVVRDMKPDVYARHRVADWWIVDAEEETVEVKRLNGGGYATSAVVKGDVVLCARPFEDTEIELRYLWGHH